ncbi:hypothetical protein KKD80_02230 [Patescibacteria group bacterium]|nr:hypothetical protein [Patescibacteria group bacterium]
MSIDFNNQKTIEAVKWLVGRAVAFDLVREARFLANFLEKNLSAGAVERPDDQLIYQELLAKVKFMALPTLGVEETAGLLQENFTLIFEISDYDLWGKIKEKLIATAKFDDRDFFKKRIGAAILANDQSLTRDGIILGGVEARGSVKNWLADARQTLGSEKVEIVQLSQYLINSANTKKLSEEERRKVDYLLKFFEKTKISSMELGGMEEITIFEVDGELDAYEEGITERIGKEIKDKVAELFSAQTTSEIQDEIQSKYRGNEAEEKKIAAEIKKIQKVAGGDFNKMADLLFRAIPGPGRAADKIYFAAILKILAEEGKIEKLLEEERFSGMVISYLKTKDRPSELAGFKANPRAAQYVSALLQYLLKDAAGMDEDESGRIGMKIFNILAKKGAGNKYQGLVYFDLEKKEFRWS